ncbi:CAP domain-containing protein [Alsobacter sp. SYSU M60028]|uniref:CAP domain-containing protein n=1 Tax=Alsobacter ponti TaxID=2962936 RepID=A0ABT1LGG9_9HYPH|nr:CAP domain-containing protein [Alsobacter ponti]MCP8940585.1 CAP domain-containing protein [Alsobacter ponti]
MRVSGFLALLLLGPGLVIPAMAEQPSARPAAAKAVTAKSTSLSDASATAISVFRRANGLGPVKSDPQLAAAARTQAQAMAAAGVMSHDVGGGFSSRIRQAGIRAGVASENVAMGQASLGEVMESWKASPGHRANLLSRSATRIGLARVDGAGGRPFWALILASPEPLPGRPPQGEHQWGDPPPWIGLFGGKP